MIMRRRHSWIAMSLLVLFVGYLSGIMGYSHVHCVNGAMIVHSHPFHGAHDHTDSESLALHFLTALQSVEPLSQELLHPVGTLLALLGEERPVEHAEVESVSAPSLRAPPRSIR